MAKSTKFESTEVEKLPEPTEATIVPEEQVVGNTVQAPMPSPEVVPTYDPDYLAKLANLSQRIKYLHSRGLTTSQIVKTLKTNAKGGVLIYQHVRNVLLQKVKTPA